MARTRKTESIVLVRLNRSEVARDPHKVPHRTTALKAVVRCEIMIADERSNERRCQRDEVIHRK